MDVERVYFTLREWVALIWGGGILAVGLFLSALATRRVGWRDALALMMGTLSLGVGTSLVAWGYRHCVHSGSRGGVTVEGVSFGYSFCLKWASSWPVAVLGASVLVGAALALVASCRLAPARQQRWLFVAAGVLTLPSILMGASPASVAIGLVPPVTLLVLGVRSCRAA